MHFTVGLCIIVVRAYSFAFKAQGNKFWQKEKVILCEGQLFFETRTRCVSEIKLGIPLGISRGFLYNVLKRCTASGPFGFPQFPPEGSPSLRRQKPDARNQTFGPISHISDPKLAF